MFHSLILVFQEQKNEEGTNNISKGTNYETDDVFPQPTISFDTGFCDSLFLAAGDKTLYRVRVGKLERSEIQTFMNELKELKFIDSVQVTRF